jgi:hypothetical protein
VLSDTHPDAEAVQIELSRQTTGAQRIAQMRSLTSLVIGLSRRAIARAHPHWNQYEVDMLWVELNYGKDLATRLRTYLEEK